MDCLALLGQHIVRLVTAVGFNQSFQLHEVHNAKVAVFFFSLERYSLFRKLKQFYARTNS
jgi:hypothetical protein